MRNHEKRRTNSLSGTWLWPGLVVLLSAVASFWPARRFPADRAPGAGVRIEERKDVETGDHVLFVGQVVAAHLDKDAGPRLVNFGDRWACAQVVPETVFER